MRWLLLFLFMPRITDSYLWASKLTTDGLVQDKSYYVVRDYEEMEADIVYTAIIDGQEVIFYILLELQSTVDYSMPIRLFLYTSEIWRKYLKKFSEKEIKKKDFKLPAVVPIVLYNGEPGWTAATEFRDKIQRSELFGNHVMNFEYALINVNKYSKEDLMTIENIVSAIFLLDQKVNAEEFVKRVGAVAKEFDRLPAAHKLKLIDWLDNTVQDPIREKIVELFKVNKEEVDRMTANITKTIQEDRAKAEKKGVEKGERKGKLEVAKKMLSKGTPIEDIIEFTGLTLEEIKGID